jgi:ankyrin repeat protein
MLVVAYAAVASSQEDQFFEAIRSDNVERVEQLIKSGEDPNRELRNRVVALHLCKSEKMAKVLLEHGAITEKRLSRLNLTPLELHTRDHALDRTSYPDGIEKRKIIDSLLRAGAIYTDKAAAYLGDVEHFRNHVTQGDWVSSKNSQDILQSAIACGNANLVLFLLESGVDPNGPATHPSLLVALDKPDLFKVLLNYDANVNQRVKREGGSSGTAIGDHASILHFACRIGSTTVVSMLLDRGADPNSQDSLGQTPLHFVAVFQPQAKTKDKPNYSSIAKKLLERGAVAGIPDSQGQSPYQVALSLNENGMPVDDLLLELLNTGNTGSSGIRKD